MEKVLSAEHKQSIAGGITQVLAVTSGQWAMGGQPVTTEGVREMLGVAAV